MAGYLYLVKSKRIKKSVKQQRIGYLGKTLLGKESATQEWLIKNKPEEMLTRKAEASLKNRFCRLKIWRRFEKLKDKLSPQEQKSATRAIEKVAPKFTLKQQKLVQIEMAEEESLVEWDGMAKELLKERQQANRAPRKKFPAFIFQNGK